MDDAQGRGPTHIIILCHPEQESFNAAVAHAYAKTVREHGHQAFVRDLYSMGFKPVLKSAERPGAGFQRFDDVEQELALLRDTDVFVLVYPLWFGTPPAMLKGYVERVLGSDAPFNDVQAGSAGGVLAGKRMISFTTSGTTDIWLDEQGQLGSLIHGFDHYIERAFAMEPSRHLHFGHVVEGMSARTGDQHLQEVRDLARSAVSDVEAERVKETRVPA